VLVVSSESEAPDVINDNIQELSPGAFDKNSEERKESFSERFADITTSIVNGDFNAAIHQLESVKSKMDGCFGGPQEQQNDWITDCAAQETLLSQIDALIAYLRTP